MLARAPAERAKIFFSHLVRLSFDRCSHGDIPSREKAGYRNHGHKLGDLLLAPVLAQFDEGRIGHRIWI